jgi:hypothetical protein
MLWVGILASCGGSSGGPLSATGNWVEQVAPAQGSAQMTLSQSGTSISGTGVQHREAGADVTFTVSATSAPVPGPGFTITYADGTAQGYFFAQTDANHFTLQSNSAPRVTRTFARQ